MKTKRVRDPRLHPRPALWRSGDKLRIKACVPTPARVLAAEQLIFLPLNANARLILILTGLLAAGVWLGMLSAPDHLPFSWQTLVLAAGAFMILWQFEKATGFRFFTQLTYRPVDITISRVEVVIGTWPFRRRLSRNDRLAFAHTPIEGAATQAYQHARILYCVVSDVRRVKICEIYGHLTAENLAANCNVALSLGFSKTNI